MQSIWHTTSLHRDIIDMAYINRSFIFRYQYVNDTIWLLAIRIITRSGMQSAQLGQYLKHRNGFPTTLLRHFKSYIYCTQSLICLGDY